MDELATLRAPAARFRQLVRETSITARDADPFYRLVRVSLSSDGFEATTPTGGAGPRFDARYDPAYFTAFDAPADPVLAALGTEATLQWLAWFDGGELTARFFGDAETGVAKTVSLDDGSESVEIGPLPSDVVDPDLASGRPGEFDGQTFAPGSDPAPTRVETDGETLERLADATDIVDDDSIPVVVSDGEFRLAVVSDVMHGRGRLSGSVDGPDCENRYGAGFAAIARVLTGPVTLQVVPGGPMAVVDRDDHATRRYVLQQVL